MGRAPSLGTKLLLPLLAVLVVGLCVLVLLDIRSVSRELRAGVRHRVDHTTAAFLAGLEALMGAGLNSEARDLLEQVERNSDDEFEEVNLFVGANLPGSGWEDDPSLLQSDADLAPEIDDPLAMRAMSTGLLQRAQDAERELVITYTPIPNRRSCHECHYPGQKTNGVLRTVVSLAKVNARIAKVRRDKLLTALVILLALALLVYLVIRTLVSVPLEAIVSTAQELAAGNVEAKVEVSSRDEVGRLGLAFNAMVDQLREARRALIERHSEELGTRERRYQTLIETVPSPIAEVDVDGRCAWLNNTGLKVLGPESVGRTMAEVMVRPEGQADAAAKIRAAFEEGLGWFELEATLRCHDGEERSLLWDFRTLRDSAGENTGALCAAHDLTDRLRMEASQREQVERMERILKTSIDGFWILDTEGFIRSANPACTALFGYSNEELLRMRVEDFEHEESSKTTLARLEEANWERAETRYVRRDGAVVDIELSAHFSERDQQTFVFLRDVTARKRVEQDRALLYTAVEQISEALYVTDTEGQISYVNPGFERLSGFSREEAIGQRPTFLRSGVHDEGFYSEMDAAFMEGRAWAGRVVHQEKGGRLYEVETTISPLHDSEGEITHCVVVEHDVTGQRQVQKLETLGTLIAGIAHEINNPINFVMLSLPVLDEFIADVIPFVDDALGAGAEPKFARLPWSSCKRELPKLVDGMRDGARRVRDIVKELKEFLVQDTALTEGPFEVRSVVESALALTAPEVRKKQAEVSVDLSEPLPTLWGIARRLEQVLVNLVVNATHFVPEEGGQICITASSASQDSQVEVVVRDNGRGVDKKVAGHIFDPFYTTRARTGGTGLGLSVSSGIVRAMGGTLTLENHAPEGACFRMVLPASGVAKPKKTGEA